MGQLSREGRKGKVFSIRLTDDERALIERAHAKWTSTGEFSMWHKPSLGEFMRRTLIKRATELVGDEKVGDRHTRRAPARARAL